MCLRNSPDTRESFSCEHGCTCLESPVPWNRFENKDVKVGTKNSDNLDGTRACSVQCMWADGSHHDNAEIVSGLAAECGDALATDFFE